MKAISRALDKLLKFFSAPAVVLAVAATLVYGFFTPFLGYYWDDLMLHWIAATQGSAGLAAYFSTNRPIWGLFYQITTSILGNQPWQWLVFALFWRWLAAMGLVFLLRQFWQNKSAALLAGLIFLTYPGFTQQYIAMLYGHFFLILSAFFFSLVFNIKAIRSSSQSQFWLYTLSAVFLSAVNLFSMEYFFTLELLRPLLLYVAMRGKPLAKRNLFSKYLPYLLVLIAAIIWRAFIFRHQTENYEFGLLTRLAQDPLGALFTLAGTVFYDLYQVLLKVWVLLVQFPDAAFGQRAWLVMAVFSLVLLVFLVLIFFTPRRPPSDAESNKNYRNSLLLSLLTLLLAGVPFWLTNIPISLTFPNDRFTLPFIAAVAVFWVSLLMIFPLHNRLRNALLIAVIALSASVHLRNGIHYQRDWENQTRFFWQLTWRVPDMRENTILFSHELPLTYFSDNSLTGGFNWIYAGDLQPGDKIPYVLYYPTIRVGLAVKDLKPDQPVDQNLLVGSFSGNTSQSLALFYQPPACLRVLDPETEPDNWMVPLQVRETIHLTNWQVILPEPAHTPPSIYGAEPAHTWCYYFQKADLARQQGDWEQVARLADTAFALDDHPNDPMERTPFIEAYAHLGNWQAALDQTQQSAAVSTVIHPALCRLWGRIERETQASAEKDEALRKIILDLNCEPQP